MTAKKINTRRRDIRLNTRATIKEMQIILEKAHFYDEGNLSRYLIRAAVGFEQKKGIK